MSAVVTRPAAPRPVARSRIQRFLTSTIGLKILMALTGVILSGFVLGHMAGNLQAFQGQKALDHYGELLHMEPALLWLVRLVLLSAVGVHIWAYIVLMRKNASARSSAYRETSHKESTYASRSMRVTGPLLLLFIIYHILHLTTGTVHPSFEEGKVYHNLTSGLSVGWVAAIYLLAMGMLGLHLWHGVWSLFQTLGANQPRYNSLGRRFATVFTVVVVLGFAAIPLAAMAGYFK
ncbi:MAG: succinate dehydrogenase cytochrome b subunit [Isosphaeraceae bacterium]